MEIMLYGKRLDRSTFTKQGNGTTLLSSQKPLNKGRKVSHLSNINIHIQRSLFPALEAEIGILSTKEQQLVRIFKLVNMHLFFRPMFMQNETQTPKIVCTGQGTHCIRRE